MNTHTHTHTGSLINVSLPSSVSRPLLIHLSCLSSFHCFHTPALHLSNHHLTHLIPLSLHATSHFPCASGSASRELWHFPPAENSLTNSFTKSTCSRVWRQEVSTRRPKLLYGWKERRKKKQTPTFSSSMGQCLKGQSDYWLPSPSEVFSSPWKDSSPYWQSSEFACSCLRSPSLLRVKSRRHGAATGWPTAVPPSTL